jgi:polysaccharide deacetylase family protein (PEP-CTERM system associated)
MTSQTALLSPPICNAMTIDVEDYFQVQGFADVISPTRWDEFPSRVERNTDFILEAMASQKFTGTFFTLGWVAERYPALVRRIVAGGHELASHGYNHQLAHTMANNDFFQDVTRSRLLLEDIGGVSVKGYRAPTFSIGGNNPQAWDILEATGYLYSSSIFPIKHDLYGMPEAPRTPYRPRNGTLLEIPLTTVRIFGRNIPCAGGGYFRLLPYWIYKLGIFKLHRVEQYPAIFYTHPWEIDPEQPRIAKARLRSRFRHRVNLHAMPSRFVSLLEDFKWGRVDEVFGKLLAQKLEQQ